MSIARWICAVFVILVAGAVPAPAQNAQKADGPPPRCVTSGNAFYDTYADNNKLDGDEDPDDVNLDLTGGYFLYDASAGDKAVTVNLNVPTMSDRVPVGGTGMAWNFIYSDGPESYRFVRRLRDFSGEYYEYGKVTRDGTAAGSFQYEGKTTGKAFPGRNGGISIVVPAAAGGVLGKQLSEPMATTTVTKQAPGAAPSLGGLSTMVDLGPDGARLGFGGNPWKVGTCPPEDRFSAEEPAPPPPPGPMEPTKVPSGEPQPQPQPAPSEVAQQQDGGPLPVKVLTRRSSRLKKGRTLVLEVRASETVTDLAAQLRRGSKVLARGKLAWVGGNAELKLKLGTKLRKGRYVLDLAGSDARGAHRFTQARLTVG